MMTPLAELHDWSIVSDESNPYLAPECRRTALNGKVYYHSHFPDGSSITTSPVVRAWEDDLGIQYAETKNTLYVLKDLDNGYIDWLNEQGKTIDILFEQFKKDI